jgi:YesN/AraC family two-component response regulator
MTAVLIIDDEFAFRALVREVLEGAGFEVYEARDGEEGIEHVKNQIIDLVVTDIYMPRKGGLETILEIRKIRQEVKIIAVSGGGMFSPEASLKTAKFRGADHVLTKPLQLDKLLSLVEEILGKIDKTD